MKTKYFILAAIAAVGLAGCSSDEFVGDNSPNIVTQESTVGSIRFGGNAGNITRATSNTGTVAQMLDGQFKVYGAKNVSSTYSAVFPSYVVWNSITPTTSNPDGADADTDANTAMNGWEYVGGTSVTYGASATALTAEQYIKYWDYAATNYHFVAGSPVANFTFPANGDIATATVNGLAGHLTANLTSGSGTALVTNPVYIADPVNVKKANFNQEVTFSFKRQQTFVRVGVFETIPGYTISSISFYPYGATGWGDVDANHSIILASTTDNYFSGASNASATLTYDWTTDEDNPTYTFVYNSGLNQAKNWYGGQLSSGVPATTSTESTVANLYGTDLDMASTGYFTVIPSASALTAAPILIKCDYTLTAEGGSGETINVKGATAAIPAAFCKWNPNTSYTYLFKISDQTNGTTGDPTTDPEGLFPITFDATVIAEVDVNKQGTITSVSTPSITTYQVGSVTSAGIEYKTGTAIYLTAQDDTDGSLKTLTDGGATVGAVQVYSLGNTEKTEADLVLTAPTGTDLFTLGSADATVNGTSFTAYKYGSFTPNTAGYYAIQYLLTAADGSKPAAYVYKVVKVAAAS